MKIIKRDSTIGTEKYNMIIKKLSNEGYFAVQDYMFMNIRVKKNWYSFCSITFYQSIVDGKWELGKPFLLSEEEVKEAVKIFEKVTKKQVIKYI